MINEYSTASPLPRRLAPVNVHAMFCKGCGIAAAQPEGRECPTCLNQRTVESGQRTAGTIPVGIHVLIVVALAVLIAGIVAALRI